MQQTEQRGDVVVASLWHKAPNSRALYIWLMYPGLLVLCHCLAFFSQQMADRAPLVRDRAEYERLYKWSIDDPQDFWANMAQDYFWAKKVRNQQPL